MISIGATDIDQDDWREGSFAVAGTEIGGRWLGNWVVVAAGVSLLAQFFSGMSAESLQVQGMADRGQLPSLFRSRSRYNTPVVSNPNYFLFYLHLQSNIVSYCSFLTSL